MKLFDYLNLDWTPAFIETKDSSGAVATASRMQVRRSIYKGSSEFWKQYEFYIDKSILELDAFDPDTLYGSTRLALKELIGFFDGLKCVGLVSHRFKYRENEKSETSSKKVIR